jgi:hypothetical protein
MRQKEIKQKTLKKIYIILFNDFGKINYVLDVGIRPFGFSRQVAM